MILHYLKKKDNQDTKLYKKLYVDIVHSTKLIAKNKLNIVDINFQITFEIVTILLFCIFFGQKSKKSIDLKNKNQILMNIFIEDIEHSLRLSGLDMTLGKHVKSYLRKFYFRISELELIFSSKNYSKFVQYLIKYNLNNQKIDDYELNFFFKKFSILIERSQKQLNIMHLFDGLFN